MHAYMKLKLLITRDYFSDTFMALFGQSLSKNRLKIPLNIFTKKDVTSHTGSEQREDEHMTEL